MRTSEALTCALGIDGPTGQHAIKCWGTNAYGELGVGDAETRGDDAADMAANLPAVLLP